jgi:hypothetical protein
MAMQAMVVDIQELQLHHRHRHRCRHRCSLKAWVWEAMKEVEGVEEEEEVS